MLQLIQTIYFAHSLLQNFRQQIFRKINSLLFRITRSSYICPHAPCSQEFEVKVLIIMKSTQMSRCQHGQSEVASCGRGCTQKENLQSLTSRCSPFFFNIIDILCSVSTPSMFLNQSTLPSPIEREQSTIKMSQSDN